MAMDRQHYAINVGTPARLPTEIINSYRGIGTSCGAWQ